MALSSMPWPISKPDILHFPNVKPPPLAAGRQADGTSTAKLINQDVWVAALPTENMRTDFAIISFAERKPLVCVLQLLIEIIEVAWQYPPQTLRLLRRFCDVHELPGIIAQAGASFRTCSGLAEPFAALFSIRLAKNSAHSATLAAQRFV